MSGNRARARAIRARMERTGEPYTLAARLHDEGVNDLAQAKRRHAMLVTTTTGADRESIQLHAPAANGGCEGCGSFPWSFCPVITNALEARLWPR
jgi:hypothetical protein